MSTATHETQSDDGVIVVEAATAQQALQQVSERIGPDAEILGAEKVLRGGIGGFFSRELVQLKVRATADPTVPSAAQRSAFGLSITEASAAWSPSPRGAEALAAAHQKPQPAPEAAAAPPKAPAPAPAPAPKAPAQPAAPAAAAASSTTTDDDATGPSAIESLLARMSDAEGARERSFGDALRDQLAGDEAATMGAPASIRPEPVAARVGVSMSTAGDGADRHAPGQAPTAIAEPPPGHDPAAAEAAHTTRNGHASPARHGAPMNGQAAPTGQVRSADAATAAAMPDGDAGWPAAPTSGGGEPSPPVFDPRIAEVLDLEPDSEREVIWRVVNLQRLGLPTALIDACRDLDPRDEIAWVERIGRLVAPLCRPLPAGNAALVGPSAQRLADGLSLPLVATGKRTVASGSFAARMSDSEANRDWLSRVRGRRWVHLVVGGQRWRRLAFEEPLAVSWANAEALPDALRLAFELGLVLGYEADRRGRVERANPLDIVLTIRELLRNR